MSQPFTNLPKLSEALAPLPQMIEAETEPLKKRRDELIDSLKRFALKHPTIDSDEAEADATEMLAVCQAFIAQKSGLIDRTLEAFKKPIMDASNAIGFSVGSAKGGPFANLATPVEAAMQTVKGMQINYKVKKDREAQIAANAEAARLAEEAELAEKIAARRGDGMADAAKIAADAEVARKATMTTTADRTRSHGDRGGITLLRWKREYRIVDAALVPREFCSPDPVKINAAKGAAKSPMPTIAGIEFSDVPDLTVGR